MATEPVLKTVECNSLGGSTPPPSANITATAVMENGRIIGAGNLADNAHTEAMSEIYARATAEHKDEGL